MQIAYLVSWQDVGKFNHFSYEEQLHYQTTKMKEILWEHRLPWTHWKCADLQDQQRNSLEFSFALQAVPSLKSQKYNKVKLKYSELFAEMPL